MQTRREFVGHLTMGAAGTALALSTLELKGCSASSVFTDILNWIPVGEASLNSILAILASNGIAVSPAAQLIVKEITDAFNAVVAAIKEYQSAFPAPVGALAKVQAALKAVVDQFTAFLAAQALPGGNIVTLVSSLAGVVFSTIAAFVNQLPLPTATTVMFSVQHFRLNGVEYNVTSIHRTRRAFKKDWNSTLDRAAVNGVQVPKSAYMHLTFFEHF